MEPKSYRAVVWVRGPDYEKPGQRVTVAAGSLDEARQKLEAQYGKGNVLDLHNEEDADRPRQ